MGVQVTQRQLSLFKSRRQRGTLPPAPSEFSLHVTIADVLLRWSLPGVEWTHFPAGELRTAATAGKLARMGTRRGWADFEIFHRSDPPRRRRNPIVEARLLNRSLGLVGEIS